MKYVRELDMLLDAHDWTNAFLIICLIHIMVSLFALQFAERLDELVERIPSQWRWIRRVATFALMLVMCWLMLYQIETGWAPWPPLVVMIAAMTLQTFSRLFIMYVDERRVRRLGSSVAALSDVLPSIRTAARDRSVENHQR